jgi:hypothetical protein
MLHEFIERFYDALFGAGPPIRFATNDPGTGRRYKGSLTPIRVEHFDWRKHARVARAFPRQSSSGPRPGWTYRAARRNATRSKVVGGVRV